MRYGLVLTFVQKLPSRYVVVKNVPEGDLTETPELVRYQREVGWFDSGSRRRGRGRGSRSRGGSRGRGRGRGQRVTGVSSRMEFLEERNVHNYAKTTRKYTRARTRGRGRARGKRTVRSWQRPGSRIPVAKTTPLNHFNDIETSAIDENIEESPQSLERDEWVLQERGAYAEADESEDQGQASEDEYDDDQPMDFNGGYGSRKPIGLMDNESESEDGDEEAEGDDGVRYEHEDVGPVEDDEEEEEEEIEDYQDGIGEIDRNGDDDYGASSYSSDYSG